MIYTCPKCGKKIDLSTEVLINSDYKVICPQCLSQLQIVGDYAYIPDESLNLDTTIEPSRSINCPKCGHQTNSNAHFCPNCGASFDTPSSSTSAIDIAPEDVTVIPPPIPNSDPLYQGAIKFLANCPSITPMMLRDHFQISAERAAELIRQLEAGGIIGPYNNGGPRQILIPHRNLYYSDGMRNPDFNQNQGGNYNNGQNRSMPRPRRSGCLFWLFFIMIFIFLMKACGL